MARNNYPNQVYEAPNAEVFEVMTQNMLCFSAPQGNMEFGDDQDGDISFE